MTPSQKRLRALLRMQLTRFCMGFTACSLMRHIPIWLTLCGGLVGGLWWAYRYACYLKWEERRSCGKGRQS